jgi:hypothetical protein
LLNQFYSLLAQSSSTGSRTTALHPAHWLLGIVVGAELSAVKLGAPFGVLLMLAVFCGIAFAIEAFGFLYLLFKDRDALRSERFTIAKMQIEKGIMGDSVAGFRQVGGSSSTPQALPIITVDEESPR